MIDTTDTQAAGAAAAAQEETGDPGPPKARRKRQRLTDTALFRYVIGPLVFVVYKGCQLICNIMPATVVYGFGRLLGLIGWYASSRRRGVAMRSLEIAFGDDYTIKERRRIGRQSFQHFMLTAMDVLRVPAIHRKGLWRQVVAMTPEEEAFAKGLADHDGPVAFHTAHMGSWEIASGLAAWSGSPCGVVYRPLDIPQLDAEVRRLRAAAGITLHPKRGALRGYVRTLRSNHWLGVIADQNAGSGGAFLNFFGVAASTQISYFPLYQRFQPRIVAVFLLRDGFKPRFHFSKFYTATCDPEANDLAEAMRLGQWYMDSLEDAVRLNPEQYCWAHTRWRSRPHGAPKLYENLGEPLAPGVLAAQPAAPIPPAKWRN